MAQIKLHILSPEGTLVEATAESVLLPGTASPFEVLPGHAPIISALDKGEIVWQTAEGEQRLAISSGFVEVKDNQVFAAIEP